MNLNSYNEKRNFAKTAEPKGSVTRSALQRFVVQEHHASRLHFDFRLEMDGVLKSWAVPKGPSKDPRAKRLAVMVEDHPIDYIDFSGHIPDDEYGGGDVVVWDHGTYETREGADPQHALADGELKVVLRGEKLKGNWELIHIGGKNGRDEDNWLLIKGRDEYVDTNWTLKQELQGGSNKDRKQLAVGQHRTKPTVHQNLPESADSHSKPDGNADLGVKAAMPDNVAPMLAVLVDKPFVDPNWLFEIKWDGYRALCFIDRGNARFTSRNGLDYTERFATLSSVANNVDAESAILDGEIVALDADGMPQFQMLQNDAGIRGHWNGNPPTHSIIYEAFDLLYVDGRDIRSVALLERKEFLRRIVRAQGNIRYCEHVTGDGINFYDAVKERGLEGVVAKKADSKYVGRRDPNWLKIKAVKRQDVVIAGFTKPRGSRLHFGALIAGVYADGRPVHVGQVGGGFDEKLLKQIYELVTPLITDMCPFNPVPKTTQPATWLKPNLVCEVKFSDWTDDNHLRPPIFLGMRDDKRPEQCVRETEKPTRRETMAASREETSKMTQKNDPSSMKSSRRSHRQTAIPPGLSDPNAPSDIDVQIGTNSVSLSNLGKVYWPEDGYTKRDLVAYYLTVADTMLPYIADRPLVLQRYPNGYNEASFYQHDVDNSPDFVRAYEVQESRHNVCYAIAENAASLAYLANLGVIPIHAWNSRAALPDHPDWIVFDLDPDGNKWRDVCDVAIATRDILQNVGLRSYAKTSGSEGLHVYVPIESAITFHEALFDFANTIAEIVTGKMPDLVTVERYKKNRGHGKVYFDCYQNSRGKTVVAPYSVRPKLGATVSTPLTWQEVEVGIDPLQFTIKTVPVRLEKTGDVFTKMLTDKQDIKNAVIALKKHSPQA